MNASPRPQVSFIILSWNVRDLLRNCLAALEAGPSHDEAEPAAGTREIIVVDSASGDGSAQMVRDGFPAVQLIASVDNLGYSRGNNLGLAAARGDFLFVLNPDTQPRPGAVAALLRYLSSHPGVGLVGPRLLNPDGSVQPSRRRWPTAGTAFFESTWLQPYAPRRLLDRFYASDLPDDRPTPVDWLTGAALFLRRAVYQQVGGLDEGFFMYSEELDWQRRIHAAGWEIHWVPAAQVVHYEGKSSAQVPAATHIRFQRSKIRYYRKYHGPLLAASLRAFLLLSFAQQLALESFKLALRHRPDLRRQRVRAYWEVLKSGL